MGVRQISKAITIGALFRVDVGNVNAGWNEGVVTTIKKVETPDGNWHPYISGQAIRRYIRNTIGDIIHDDPSLGEMSPEEAPSDPKAPVLTVGDPRKYVDDDIFGFMRAIKSEKSKSKKTDDVGNTRKRTSPLRVAPAYGLFKMGGDRDLGTRSAITAKGSANAGGSIFETEITNNIFRTSILLELDRIGIWEGYETVDKKESKTGGYLPEKERKNRIVLILQALKYLWGGGRQSRFLVDLSPQFILYARMARKVPIFLNALSAEYSDNGYVLGITQMKEVLNDYKYDIGKLIVGSRTGFIRNADELQQAIGIDKIYSVGEAIGLMIDDSMSSSLPEK